MEASMWKLIGITAGVTLWTLFIICPPCSGQTPETTGIQFGYENFCSELEAGKRIRVTIPVQPDPNLEGYLVEEEVLTGTFQSCGDGMLVIKPEKSGSDPLSIPLEDIQWLQVSQGKSGHALPGAFAGLAVGIVISVAAQTNHHQDEFLGGLEDMEDNVTRGAGITVGTTILGAVIGSVIGSEKWQSVNAMNWSASLRSGGNGDYQVVVSCSF
jgi:hypothetical protein